MKGTVVGPTQAVVVAVPKSTLALNNFIEIGQLFLLNKSTAYGTNRGGIATKCLLQLRGVLHQHVAGRLGQHRNDGQKQDENQKGNTLHKGYFFVPSPKKASRVNDCKRSEERRVRERG